MGKREKKGEKNRFISICIDLLCANFDYEVKLASNQLWAMRKKGAAKSALRLPCLHFNHNKLSLACDIVCSMKSVLPERK